MTNLIRLNESINDYAARPVITRLGEPDLAIRPSTYLDALWESTNIDPEQILIDGSYGQTVNPTPFTGVGTGSMTIKSDADGVYLSMMQMGINTDLVMNTRNDRGSLAIIKYRLNSIFEDNTRVVSVGSTIGNTASFSLTSHLDPERVTGRGGYSAERDDLVHTLALHKSPDWYGTIEGNKKYTASSITTTSAPNTLTGVGINTRSNTDIEPNDLDLYNFELYLDVSLTEQQIMDYLKTL